MKRLKCKKIYGEWFYRKVVNDDLDAPIYELYDDIKTFIEAFGSYGDMKYFVENNGAYL